MSGRSEVPDAASACGAPLVRALNRDCECVDVDVPALRQQLEQDLRTLAAPDDLFEGRPHLFAAHPVFLAREEIAQMKRIVRACESALQRPGLRAAALLDVPEIARRDHGPLGAFVGYDFHLTDRGPRLIEINTNAGGGLLGAHLAAAQRACCSEMQALLAAPVDRAALEREWMAMFRSEWQRQGIGRELARVAIVDDDPGEQFLHPEMLLFQRLFERNGIEARLVAARDLRFEAGADVLRAGDWPIDLVYNRLTDFYLQRPQSAALAQAYRTGGVALTPGPRAHALYAHKRNLVWLSDSERLAGWGLDAESIRVLGEAVPEARLVTADNADALWAERRHLYFKPLTGHASRGVYRGAGLTRRVWRSILNGHYIGQRRVDPSERELRIAGVARRLKLDLRCFVYAGRVQLLGARLYHGQVTNLRSLGGGLAPVATPRCSGDTPCAGLPD